MEQSHKGITKGSSLETFPMLSYIYNDEEKFRKQIVSFHKNLYKESIDWRQWVS